jgi:porphobilinogen deaminase
LITRHEKKSGRQRLKRNADENYDAKMLADSAGSHRGDTDTIDDKIAYHEEMEHIANRAGDFTKAEHHRKMQEIYKAIQEAIATEAVRSERRD